MNKNILKIRASVLFCLFFFANSFIFGQISTEWTISSKSFGLGQTTTLSNSTVLNAVQNPSSITSAQTIQSSFYYSKPFEDTENFGIGILIPTKGYGNFGFSYINFLTYNIPEYNSIGVRTGSFSFSQKEYVFTYGFKSFERYSFGINAKWFSDKYSGLPSSGWLNENFGLDFSIGVFPNVNTSWLSNFGLGITLKNFIQLNEDEPLPKEIRIMAEDGYQFDEHSIFLVMNYSLYENFELNYQSRFHAGLEYGYDFIFLRAGYRDDLITAGAGIIYSYFSFDYGYGEYINHYFKNQFHNFTVNLNF